MITSRRSFLTGLAATFAAPAIVSASSLMPVKGIVMAMDTAYEPNVPVSQIMINGDRLLVQWRGVGRVAQWTEVPMSALPDIEWEQTELPTIEWSAVRAAA